MKLTSYPGTVRQLVVTGLGRDAPTVIITNDTTMKTRALITQYARRMTIEQRLAEIIRAFCADALSSTVNLNVDLDVVLAVLAQALTAALRARLPGYATVTPDTIQRRFLETPGQVISTPDAVTVRLERRAFSPVLRSADLPPATPVPWWGRGAPSATSSPESCPDPPAWKSALNTRRRAGRTGRLTQLFCAPVPGSRRGTRAGSRLRYRGTGPARCLSAKRTESRLVAAPGTRQSPELRA